MIIEEATGAFPGLKIPYRELDFTYVRSSGPGGQNVNKVNSKAVLRWSFVNSGSLSVGVRARFLEKFGTRLSEAGDLLISSDRFRDQAKNMEDCLAKLRALLLEVSRPPKIRKATKPSRSSKRRRVEGKKMHSEKKRARSNRYD